MTDPPIRLAELMAALSLAIDLSMGQPVEFAWQACVVAMRLAKALRLSEAELRAVYYQSLLRYIGCNAETRLLAAVFGDELALRADLIHADASGPEFRALSLRFIREAHAGASPLQMLGAVVGGLAQMTRASREFFTVARRLCPCVSTRMDLACDRAWLISRNGVIANPTIATCARQAIHCRI